MIEGSAERGDHRDRIVQMNPFDAKLFGTATNNGQMIEELNAKAFAADLNRE